MGYGERRPAAAASGGGGLRRAEACGCGEGRRHAPRSHRPPPGQSATAARLVAVLELAASRCSAPASGREREREREWGDEGRIRRRRSGSVPIRRHHSRRARVDAGRQIGASVNTAAGARRPKPGDGEGHVCPRLHAAPDLTTAPTAADDGTADGGVRQ